MKKCVWRVTGWELDFPGSPIFEAHFSDRDTAEAVYAKGEREYGIGYGYTAMRWELEGFYLDDNTHIDQMFTDVRDAMEEA